MYNLDDQNLDRLSAEAAENYKPPLSNPSWDAMQQTLDHELPQEKKRRRGILWFFLALGLLAGGSFYWYSQQKDTTNAQPRVATNENKPGADQKTKDNSSSNDKSTTAASSNEKVSPHPPPDKQKADKPATSNPASAPVTIKDDKRLAQTPDKTNPVNTYQPEKRADKVTVQKEKKLPVIVANNNKEAQDVTVDKRKTVIANGKRKNKTVITPGASDKSLAKNSNDVGKKANVVAMDKKEADSNIKEDKDQKTTEPPVTTPPVAADQKTVTPPADQKTIIPADPAVNNTKPSDSTATEKKEVVKKDDKKPSNKKEKAYSISFLAGVDLSTVKFKYGDNSGYNFGLLGGYHFNKNWSVHTGLIYTKKVYKLGGKDYHPPPGYFTYNATVDLISVQGYCRMFEVPVIGRYTFNSSSKGKFFASTGLSSYFMQEEDYVYDYKYNGTPTRRAWTNTDKITHWFSILHLSAGFEKPLGKHLLWQVEPYAKLPISGIGFGDIKLSSFGVNFALQFKQPIKK